MLPVQSALLCQTRGSSVHGQKGAALATTPAAAPARPQRPRHLRMTRETQGDHQPRVAVPRHSMVHRDRTLPSFRRRTARHTASIAITCQHSLPVPPEVLHVLTTKRVAGSAEPASHDVMPTTRAAECCCTALVTPGRLRFIVPPCCCSNVRLCNALLPLVSTELPGLHKPIALPLMMATGLCSAHAQLSSAPK